MSETGVHGNLGLGDFQPLALGVRSGMHPGMASPSEPGGQCVSTNSALQKLGSVGCRNSHGSH